jgi:hypothetical protein
MALLHDGLAAGLPRLYVHASAAFLMTEFQEYAVVHLAAWIWVF